MPAQPGSARDRAARKLPSAVSDFPGAIQGTVYDEPGSKISREKRQMTSQSETAGRAGCGAASAASCSDAFRPGSGLYIAATVVAFLVFWPVGLVMLAWALWHRQIRASSWWQSLRGVRPPTIDDIGAFARRRPSNEALAEYLAREQQRLREEQQKLDDLVKAFEAFKEAERKASDQRDFENFLRSREGGAP